MKMITEQELEFKLSEPSERLVNDISKIKGDFLVLGAAGKMGPSLTKLLVNAVKKAGERKKVIAVSRFSDLRVKEDLESSGVITISADLMDDKQLEALPDIENVIYMAGTKFGTTGNEHYTWAMNSYLPGKVATKYKNSRIVVFSTGNVYPLSPTYRGGATEDLDPNPVGEYGQSCLGRERIYEHFSLKYDIPMVIFRLNYAIDLRYGVLLEIANSVKNQKPFNLSMGNFNCIWQGDANEWAIRSLTKCTSPPNYINISGPETISFRWVAEEFGKRFNVEPVFEAVESDTALLSNCSKAHQLFGYPTVSLLQMLDWVEDWVSADGLSWNKPTHFQEREGKF